MPKITINEMNLNCANISVDEMIKEIGLDADEETANAWELLGQHGVSPSAAAAQLRVGALIGYHYAKMEMRNAENK